MKLTQLGDLSFFQFIDVFTKAKVNDFVSITNHVPPLPLLRTAHHLSKSTKMFLRRKRKYEIDSIRGSFFL